MQIRTENLGKRFGGTWLFRDLNLQFTGKGAYALTGHNGSGKSTFLKILAGYLPPSRGQVHWRSDDGKPLASENWYKHLAWAGPYTELVEEMTLKEMLAFYSKFKYLKISTLELEEELALGKTTQQLKFFSSGMKQKLKLALAFYGTAEVLLLDEPTSNLDSRNAAWYQSVLEKSLTEKLILIASNEPKEYTLAQDVFTLA
jgi:ABC-type multidrug transport system ATPase subunit